MTIPTQNRTPFLITTRKFPQDFIQLEPVLTKMYFEVSNAVNTREVSLYELSQINTGQKWFNTGNPINPLQAFRTVYTRTGIPNGNTTITHNLPIDINTQFVNIYGTANRPNTKFVPLPFVDGSGGGDNIGLFVDTTNIHIVTTTANWTAYNAIIVLEYILNN